MKTSHTQSSLNDQFRAGQMDLVTGPRKNKGISGQADKYHVKIKDNKGLEYVVKYM